VLWISIEQHIHLISTCIIMIAMPLGKLKDHGVNGYLSSNLNTAQLNYLQASSQCSISVWEKVWSEAGMQDAGVIHAPTCTFSGVTEKDWRGEPDSRL